MNNGDDDGDGNYDDDDDDEDDVDIHSFFHWGYSSKQWQIVPYWPLLGSIRRIPSRVTASGYIFRSTFRSLSEVLCSDECRTKKAFLCAKRMLQLFRAVETYRIEIIAWFNVKLYKYNMNIAVL